MGVLPKVSIEYGNGALGQAVTSADGVLCIAVCGISNYGNSYFSHGTPYAIYSYQDFYNLLESAKAIGYNSYFLRVVKEFYSEAQEGTKLYVVGYPDTLNMSTILNKSNPYLTKVVEQTNGEIRGFIVSTTYEKSKGYKTTQGFIDDLVPAITNAQGLGVWATEVKHAPLFTILDGFYFDGLDPSKSLLNTVTMGCNRVGVVVGSVNHYDENQSVGLVAGRIAATPVHRNIGRVKTGALNATNMYIYDKSVETSQINSLTACGFITFRTFTGLAGYYIADDLLCTSETDDYNRLTHRRTIDKAYRIAYPCLVEELLDEIPVNEDGTMLETYATAFEQKVINAIALNMTARGELSADPTDANDQGVKCIVDRTNNILATSQIKATLRVRPFGHARYIDVLLGFTVTAN